MMIDESSNPNPHQFSIKLLFGFMIYYAVTLAFFSICPWLQSMWVAVGLFGWPILIFLHEQKISLSVTLSMFVMLAGLPFPKIMEMTRGFFWGVVIAACIALQIKYFRKQFY